MRQIGRRGAYPLLRLTFGGGLVYHRDWLRTHRSTYRRAGPIDLHALQHCDALVAIFAPETPRRHDISAERISAVQGRTGRPSASTTSDLPVGHVLVPDAGAGAGRGHAAPEFADFLYGACLLDWEAENAPLPRHAALFDAADEVRIVGDGTDLRCRWPAGRGGRRRHGQHARRRVLRLPGRDLRRGHHRLHRVPAIWRGREVRGIRLRFSGGRVVDASADSEEEFLLQPRHRRGRAAHRRARHRLQPGITRYMRNVYFDEKINGTIHLALGFGFADLGGTNESAIHWDIVKDLRGGGRIELDGKVVQENGRWRL